MNEAISDYSDFEGSDCVPSEDENFEYELFEFIDSENDVSDSENDVSDVVEEDCDVNVDQSVQEDLGFVPNITCNCDDVDSEDDLDSLYSVSSDGSGYYQGYILAAVGIDADSCIYPITVAAVEAETRDSWSWFLHLLANDLDIVKSYHMTFMYFNKRCCVRHLYYNFKDVEGFKGKVLEDCLWKAARATTLRDSKRGIPCAHDVSAILFIQERPESYVDPFYHKSTQINIYSNIIYPIRGANQREVVPSMEPILHPVQRRPPGHNIRTCKGQVGGNSRLNTLSASQTGPTAHPSQTGPAVALLSASTTRPQKLSCKRPTPIEQEPSQPISQSTNSLQTLDQRKKIKVEAGRILSPGKSVSS
ncbi:hypothetical protein V6N13_025400 [Hibiscus sabdariffa]